jgi:hypothetical protein
VNERDILGEMLKSRGTTEALLTAIVETTDVGKTCAMFMRELPQRLSTTEYQVAVAVARAELMCELLRLIVGDYEVDKTKRVMLEGLQGQLRSGKGWT